MTDFARLAIEIDSTDTAKATAELEKLTAAGARTEQSTKGVEQSARRTSQALASVGASAGAQRAGMQQLSYQIGDVSQQFALGANPMMIFAQQGGQVVQALNMMKGGASGLVGFLAGPWGTVLLGATMIMGSFMASSKEAEKANYQLGDALDFGAMSAKDFADATRQLADAQERQTKSAYDNEKAALAAANASLKAAIAKRDEARATIQAWKAEMSRTGGIDFSGAGDPFSERANLGRGSAAGAAEMQLGTLDAAQADAERRIRNAKIPIAMREAAAATDGAAAATLRYDQSLLTLTENYRLGRMTYEKYVSGRAALNATLERETEAARESGRAHRGKTQAERDAVKAARELESAYTGMIKALDPATLAANKYAESLVDIAKLETVGKIDADTAALYRQAAAFDEVKAAADRQRAAEIEFRKSLSADMQAAGKPLVGDDGLTIRGAAIDASNILGQSAKDVANTLANDGVAAAQAIAQVIGGSVGSLIGQLLGMLDGLSSGNFNSVGGRLGGAMTLLSKGSGKEAFAPLTKKLDEIFGGDGKFTKEMKNIVGGAGLGSIAGSAAGGDALGGAIGGVVGQVAGKAIGKSIGGLAKDLGGPLGAIAGGVLGGVIGGLMKKTKWGRVDLTSTGQTQAGNSSAAVGAAVQAGGAFTTGLGNIASQFGGTVGDFGSISIGQRHGDWRVNGSGTSLKVKGGATDFNGDAEAAISYAIELAIERGAITGIRNSTQNLLRASGDLQAKLDKALKFEGVFTSLKKELDPVGYAIETLDKEFANLRTIFAEAGASVAEYAQLEQLYQLQRVEAIKEANSEADRLSRDRRTLEARILDLQGKSAMSVAMMRQVEIEQMDASLQPLQLRVWALEDAADTVAKFSTYVESLTKYRDELFGSQSGQASYNSALVKLMATGGLAATGDTKALGELQGVSQTFLTAAESSAKTSTEYQRAIALVAGYVDGGIGAAQSQIDYAKSQAESLNTVVELLTSLDSNIATVTMQSPAVISTSSGSASSNAELLTEIKALRAELTNQGANSARVAQLLGRWDRGASMAVTADTASPVPVSVIP